MARSELLIARLPGRTGLYLGFSVGSRWTTLARFQSEEKAEQFKDWARGAGILVNPPEEK